MHAFKSFVQYEEPSHPRAPVRLSVGGVVGLCVLCAGHCLAGEKVPQFKDPVLFPVGEDPRALASADASENGYPDVAVSDGECHITLYRNTGNWDDPNQGFEEPDILGFPGAAPCPVCLEELEFGNINLNQDQHLDIVVADSQTPAVWVFYADPNDPGHYSQPPTEFPIPLLCTGLVVADLDNDGYDDVALAADDLQMDECDKVIILWNDQDGGFEDPPDEWDLELSELGYEGPVDLAVGHFASTPGVPTLDLVTANPTLDSITVLKNLGNREFVPQTTDKPDSCATPSWRNFYSITSGRFDADLNHDAVAPEQARNYAAVFLGVPDGSFSHDCSEDQTDTYDLGGGMPWGSHGGHLNGGTRLDLAFALVIADQIGVLLGKGDGTFQMDQSDPNSPTAYLYDLDNDPGTDRGPWDVRIVDLNMDGFGDLVTCNWVSDDISVLINKMEVAILPPGP